MFPVDMIFPPLRRLVLGATRTKPTSQHTPTVAPLYHLKGAVEDPEGFWFPFPLPPGGGGKTARGNAVAPVYG